MNEADEKVIHTADFQIDVAQIIRSFQFLLDVKCTILNFVHLIEYTNNN